MRRLDTFKDNDAVSHLKQKIIKLLSEMKEDELILLLSFIKKMMRPEHID